MRTVTKMYRYQLYECVPCPYSHAVSFAAAAIGGRRVNVRDITCSSRATYENTAFFSRECKFLKY